MPTITLQNTADMAAVVTKVLAHVDASSQAVVVALHGDLGAGKTTFVQMLAQRIGIVDEVTSPTFTIMKRYDLPAPQHTVARLIHIDAYRIEDPHEMEILGFSNLLSEAGSLVCIEWAERIKSLLPQNLIDLTIDITDQDGGRRITIHGY